MPVQITVDIVPMGVAMNAGRAGDTATVRPTGFLSTEDGQDFITHVEQFPTTLLARACGGKVQPSQVDTLLAIVRPDRTATVYVNEILPELLTTVTRPRQKGDAIIQDDIADIARAELGVEMPADAAVVFVFSWGWRKGVFYDFGPVGPKRQPRAFDLPTVIGQLYARLLFQNRFRITDAEWEALTKGKWFPFVGLKNETIDTLVLHARQGWNLDDMTAAIAAEVRGKAPEFLAAWKRHPAFAAHAPVLEKAIEHFLGGDHISCTGLLFPRIEGILRSNHAACDTSKATQASLSRSAVSAKAGREWCLLLPHRFEGYLKDVYFASFDPNATGIDVLRNSVGHGVADPAAFNEKSSAIGLLVVQQLFHSFDQPDGKVEP